MLEGRLQKRLRVLGMSSHDEYCEFVFSEAGQQQELIHMIDVVTTNKTDFFREPSHFDYLSRVALPEMIERYSVGSRNKLKIWSAGCSTGEEPYTLAMVLNEFQQKHAETALETEIFATDISTRVLEHARKAVYTEERIAPVPEPLRRKYLLRSRDRSSGLVRIDASLRRML